MKKVFVLALFAAILAFSCQKNENPTLEKKGVPMKLIADFNKDTKVTYAPDGNVLKTSWEATETISVLTLNGAGKLQTVDNFTSIGEAGRTTAEFTGTFTGGADPVKVVVIYPALIYDGYSYYSTDMFTDRSGSHWSILYNAQIGSEYIQGRRSDLKQTADNDASHLRNYCVMDGVANKSDIKSNILNVTLSNEMTVIKVTATFPDAMKGKTLNSMEIRGWNNAESDEKGWVRSASWEYVDLPGNDGICGRGGGYNSNVKLYSNFEIPASGVVTLFYVNHKFGDLEVGDKLKFTATVNDTEQSPATKTVTSAVSFEKGKIYRMSVTIPD